MYLDTGKIDYTFCQNANAALIKYLEERKFKVSEQDVDDFLKMIHEVATNEAIRYSDGTDEKIKSLEKTIADLKERQFVKQ